MATIYFATNRNPDDEDNPKRFGGEFNPRSVDNLRFGRATVVGKRVRTIRTASESLAKDPGESKLGSKAILNALKRDMKQGIDTLVFIHGYNVSFNEALVTAGALQRKYKGTKGINVLVFSWPSDGSMMPFLAYKSDRTDAAASAPAFARGLLKLRDYLSNIRRGAECGARLHLMCHSMGNFVLRNGIQEVLRLEGSLPRMFDEIFLMAADEDHDAFEKADKLLHLPELGGSVSVYFNSGDTALVVSDRTKSNPTRLGSRGPRQPLNVPGNVTLVDASEVVGGLVEHSYFWDDKHTVRDVAAVLAKKPADRIPKRRYVTSQNKYVLVK